MPTIKVDFGKLSQLESQLSRVPGVISSAASSVSSVRSGLDWDVACEASIDRKLRDIANALNDSKSRMQKTAQFVGDAVQQYQKAENGVEQRIHSGGGRSAGGGSRRSFTALSGTYQSQFWDSEYNSKKFSSVSDICEALSTSPFNVLNVLSKANSYYQIIGDIISDGFEQTVDFLAEQYNITKDKVIDLGECIKSDIIEAANAVVDNWKTGATIIKGTLSDCVSAIQEDYKAKGTSYRILNGIKAVGDIVVGTTTVVCAVAGTGVTAGLGTPATVLIGTYGGNQAISGFADLFNCITGNVDDVGEVNLLKSGLSGVCGQAGEWLGNRELGESVGESIYTIGGLTSTVVSLGNLSGQIKQAHSSGKTLSQSFEATKAMFSKASKELPDALSGVGYIATKSNMSSIPYNLSLLSKGLPNINAVISDVNLISKGVDESKKIIDAGIDVVNTLAGCKMIEEPTYFKSVDEISDTLETVSNPLQTIEKITESGKQIEDVISIQLLDLFDPVPVWDL